MTETHPENRRLGYARVSTYGQTLDAQLEQLRGDGCGKVYREKASGAQADRRELQRMLKAIQPGDIVTVTRIDRLARSTFDLFAIVKAITDAGGQFRSLAEPWADTATSTGRLMIAVLGGLADVERDLIRTRTAEGRSRAKGRGQHMGRPPALTPQQQAEARQRRGDGATLKELAQSYNVGISTIARLTNLRANQKMARTKSKSNQGNLILQQTMLNEANAFFQAGSRCAASFDLSPNVCNELTTPAIVCYAYACELYLKLLNDLSQGSYETGHHLDELFAALPDAVKDVAFELYSTGTNTKTVADFTAGLIELSNAFVDLRYWNEQQPMIWPTPVEIRRIATVFHRSIRKIYPTLLVTFENRPLPL